MLWDIPTGQALLNSLLLGMGAALLSTLVGGLLAVATSFFRVAGHRFLAAVISALVLLPLYIQATAWSAGFGNQGWFRWSQVQAAINNHYALMACVWIQAAWLVPFCFLIIRLGLTRANDDSIKFQLLDQSPLRVLCSLIYRKLRPWIGASLLLGFVLTSSDMVVTNLFQVPTLTESLYQQVQFQKPNQNAIFVAIFYSIGIGCFMGYVGFRFGRSLSAEQEETVQENKVFQLRGVTRLICTALSWGLFSAFIGFPMVSLMVKTGWQVSMRDNETIRTWSLAAGIESFRVLSTFSTEFYWSLIISGLATAMSLFLAGFLLVVSKSDWASGMCLGLMGFAISVPGPLINSWLQQVFSRPGTVFEFLQDRTVLLPVLGLQFRCLPILYGVFWLAQGRLNRRYAHLMSLDGTTLWHHKQAMVNPILIGLVIVFYLSFANLETYLLVLPPSVTTIAMRMFELLHYGVQNQEATLALCLAAASSLTAYFLATHSSR